LVCCACVAGLGEVFSRLRAAGQPVVVAKCLFRWRRKPTLPVAHSSRLNRRPPHRLVWSFHGRGPEFVRQSWTSFVVRSRFSPLVEVRLPRGGFGRRTLAPMPGSERSRCLQRGCEETDGSVGEVSTVSCSSVGGNSGRRKRDTPTLGRGLPWLGRRTPRACVDGEPGYPSLCCIAPVWRASRVWPQPLAAKVEDAANEALEHVGITERIWPRGNSRPLMLDGRAASLLVTRPRRFSGKRTEPIRRGQPWT
jgi:hypothetical protein